MATSRGALEAALAKAGFTPSFVSPELNRRGPAFFIEPANRGALDVVALRRKVVLPYNRWNSAESLPLFAECLAGFIHAKLPHLRLQHELNVWGFDNASGKVFIAFGSGLRGKQPSRKKFDAFAVELAPRRQVKR